MFIPECHCGKEDRTAACASPDVPLSYSCGAPCGRRLDCGNHSCEAVCHADECAPCQGWNSIDILEISANLSLMMF